MHHSFTPPQLAQLMKALAITQLGMIAAPAMPVENQRHFLKNTQIELYAAFDAAVEAGFCDDVKQLVDAVDVSIDHRVQGVTWVELVNQLRRKAASNSPCARK